MIAIFPSLYPDEVLYSGIARYHQRTASKSFRETITDLFDDNVVCSTIDLPSHLEKLSKNLAADIDAEYLINSHTLLPYYAPFLTKERYDRVRSFMKHGAHSGEAHAIVGLLASRVQSPSYLKYCHECFKADNGKYGEPYWHRVHQLPGVLICPHHGNYLTESTVKFNTNDHKQEFIVLSSFSSRLPIINNYSERDQVHLLYFAKQSYELLGSSLQPINHEFFREHYLCRMQSRGLVTAADNYRMRHIVSDFKKMYSDDLLALSGDDFASTGQFTWLHRLLRKFDSCHPLRQLFVLRFLGDDVKILMQEAQDELSVSASGKKNIKSDLVTILSAPRHSKELDSRRKQMLQTISLSEGCNRKEIRSQNMKDYAWLYRHDRNWLFDKLPKVEKPNKLLFVNRVNWEQRDSELAKLVADAINHLLDENKPTRISYSAVGRHINRRNLIDKHLEKLPRTKALIEQHIETTEQYQIRRLEWAFRQMLMEEGSIMGWKLLKKARIPDKVSEAVLRKLRELLVGYDDLYVIRLERRLLKNDGTAEQYQRGILSSSVS
ncbi:MAG: TnsD family Tn7-like transposition protein [Bacillota bacterium]